jgi:site-specific recombinase XerD
MRIIGAFSVLPSRLHPGDSARVPAMGRASIRGTRHTLRHSLATHFVRDGGSVYTLKRNLGHSDIKTTERHVHAASVQDMAAALDKIDWI